MRIRFGDKGVHAQEILRNYCKLYYMICACVWKLVVYPIQNAAEGKPMFLNSRWNGMENPAPNSELPRHMPETPCFWIKFIHNS